MFELLLCEKVQGGGSTEGGSALLFNVNAIASGFFGLIVHNDNSGS